MTQTETTVPPAAPPQASPGGTALFRASALEQVASPDRIDLAPRVVRPAAWVALASLALVLLGGLGGTALVDVPVQVVGAGLLLPGAGALDAVLFVRPDQAQALSPGLPAQVAVESGRPLRLHGRVVSIATRPASAQAIVGRVGSAPLGEALAQAGATIEVDVALEAAPPDVVALLCRASITARHRSLLSLLLGGGT